MSVTKTKNNVKKDPLMHLTRLPDPKPRHYWFSKLFSVLVALLICAIITTAMEPGNFINFFKYLGLGTFSNGLQVIRLIQDTAVLLIIALALTPAFKMKFWNIGAEGQILIGCLASAGIAKFMPRGTPNTVILIICAIASIVAGVIWSVIPAIFKAFLNKLITLLFSVMIFLVLQSHSCSEGCISWD